MNNLTSSFLKKNPKKKTITTTIAFPLGLGSSFQKLKATVVCLFEVQDCAVLFYEERKSHMLPTLDLLILYKFFLPNSGVAVSSFVYLHSNNIMKTESGLQNTPFRAMSGLNPARCLSSIHEDCFYHYFGRGFTSLRHFDA